MIVTLNNFHDVLEEIRGQDKRALDTETTGLRPYHGNMLFSVIIATKKKEYYFNFNEYANLEPIFRLPDKWIHDLNYITQDTACMWYFHNAKFDMAMLWREGVEVTGHIWDVKVIERVIDNDLIPGSYDLDSIAQRRGWRKDDAVKKHILANGLWDWEYTAVSRRKKLHYNQVPFDIIVPYGERDARITFDVGQRQEKELAEMDKDIPIGWPKIRPVVLNECRLLPVVYNMERVGVQIDRDFCERAIEHESKTKDEKTAEFKEITGREFKKSNKLFQEIFADEQSLWGKTKPTKTKPNGGVSFDKDTVLPNLKNPAAKVIIKIAEAKSNIDYFKGFLYHADSNGVIHTSFNQDGTDTGRFSSSDPNLQNLKKVDKDEEMPEFHVRRAIVPRPGRCFVMMDYDQFQYRLMLDYCNAKNLIKKILDDGVDVHQATADVAGIERYKAKTTNFSILFGAGIGLLSRNLGCSELEARTIKDSVFRAAPEIQDFVQLAIAKAEKRKWVFNWFGRRYKFPNIRIAFTAPNKIIQGGEADTIKIGMNRVYDYLKDHDSEIVLTIHDEIVLEMPREEFPLIPEIKEILETVYPHRHLPMTVGVAHSWKSLADKVEGVPSE